MIKFDENDAEKRPCKAKMSDKSIFRSKFYGALINAAKAENTGWDARNIYEYSLLVEQITLI